MNYQNQSQTFAQDNNTSVLPHNILNLSPEQRCQVLLARLKYLHEQDKSWTLKHVAELSGLSEVTVRSILTDPEYDPRSR